MSDEVAVIHIDGASRGNPGDAAYAVTIALPGRPIVEEAGVLGKETNNVAEYTALVKALEKAQTLGLRRLSIHSDSELLVKQMNGEYRVKNEDLKPLYEEAKALATRFTDVQLTHVRRADNKRADELCNIALDGAKPKTATVPGVKKPSGTIGDQRVRDDCLDSLRSARACWARGEAMPSPELVWDQVWSILEAGGVLRKTK